MGGAGALGRLGGVPLGSAGVAFPDPICAGSLEAFPGENGFVGPESGAGEGVAGDGHAGAGLARLGDSEDAGAFEVDVEPSDITLSSMGALVLFCEEGCGSSLEEPGTRSATSDVWLAFGGSTMLAEAEEGADFSVQSGAGEAGTETGAALGFVAIETEGGTRFDGGSSSLGLLLAPTS